MLKLAGSSAPTHLTSATILSDSELVFNTDKPGNKGFLAGTFYSHIFILYLVPL